jgi:hypothetical protein
MDRKELIRLLATTKLQQEVGKDVSDEALNALLSEFMEAKESQHSSPGDVMERLLNRYNALSITSEFKPGQLVRWKSGLRNRRRPRYNEPAIVVAVIEAPIITGESDSGSTYFREPLDIVLGLLDSDGDFLCFHYDKRRFEAWTPQDR